MPISSGGMGFNSTGPNPPPKWEKSKKGTKTVSTGVGKKKRAKPKNKKG